MPSPHKRSAGHWFASPLATGFLAVLSVVISIVGVIPLLYSAFFTNQLSVVSLLFGSISVLFIIVTVAAINQLRSGHSNSNELELVKQQLVSTTNTQAELEKARTSRDSLLSNFFLSIARARANHSVDLYTIQDAILSSNDVQKEAFFTAWQRQVAFLNDYCSLVSNLFSGIKGEQCCCNIKVFWRGSDDSSLLVEHTEFGVTPGEESVRDSVYTTVARCYTSKNDGRFTERATKAVPVHSNIIFRRMVVGSVGDFLSNDIEMDIAHWRDEVEKRHFKPFIYPDTDSKNYYKNIISVPIMVSGILEGREAIRSEKFERIIGVLSVDSKDDIAFNKTFDLSTCEQLAFNLASSFFEYFRCVKHLERRMSCTA